MPIIGLTNRGLAFPEIGSIRKGTPKRKNANGVEIMGKDLAYFRVEFDEKEVETSAHFNKVYGAQPAEINIVLPFNEVDRCWEAWLEAYTAGRMVARSDGEKFLYWVDTVSGELKVKDGKDVKTGLPVAYVDGMVVGKDTKNQPVKCKPTGRLKCVVPELQRLAYLTAITNSIHDIMNISGQLEAIRQVNDGHLAGIPLVLRRRPKEISCPVNGKRVRVTKFMLSIEADPQWVKAKLMDMKRLALPGNGLDMSLSTMAALPEPAAMRFETYEDDEDYGEEEDVVEAVTAPAAPAAAPFPELQKKASIERPFSSEVLKSKLLEAEKKLKNDYCQPEDTQGVAACLSYVFMSETKRHDLIKWLTDGRTDSMKNIGSGMTLALKRWLKPVYSPEQAVFMPQDEHANAEANGAWRDYMISIGQLDLFGGPVDQEAAQAEAVMEEAAADALAEGGMA